MMMIMQAVCLYVHCTWSWKDFICYVQELDWTSSRTTNIEIIGLITEETTIPRYELESMNYKVLTYRGRDI